MNKTAIKNFAIWARNKLIADIIYKAGLLGITEKGIKSPLPQSTQTVQFFDIGTKEPSSINGIEIQQRKKLVEEIERKAKQIDYSTAYKNVIEEVAYTWFNRLIAIRFMEVNDYLPTRIRVLSSESNGKAEPDLVTHALEANLDYSAYEKDRIIQLKHENKLDELFRMLFIKQCNSLNANLPELFEKTSDYTELLLKVSFTDKEGVVYHLINDISEDDFNISKEGQVEIIGWLYQYYNTEPKDETFALLKKNVKITKDRIPAATQLFTPDWIVRYMVENSLGRLWLEAHPNDKLKSNWKYFLEEAEQTPEVDQKLRLLRTKSIVKSPEDIRLFDPCMGSGHILVYAFDVLIQIYESEGYNSRDAAKLILEKNIYGLDIDRRAYQLTYFSLMMKARQYSRRIFSMDIKPQVYHPAGFPDGEEYGSLVKIDLLPLKPEEKTGQLSLEDISYDIQLNGWNFKRLLAQKYHVVCTNPPYMGSTNMSIILSDYIKTNYNESKTDLYSCFIKKCCDLCFTNGFVSMITMESWMFLSKFNKFRQLLLKSISITSLIHMPYDGKGKTSLGISFGTSAFSFRKSHLNYNGQYMCIRYYENDEDGTPIEYPTVNERYNTAHMDDFYVTDDMTISYWISSKMRELFAKGNILRKYAEPRQGLATSDNDRFLRFWYEVDRNRESFDTQSREEANSNGKKWFAITKGGEFRKWYGNNFYVVDWENDGADMKATVLKKYPYLNTPEFVVKNQKYYFRPGITWSTLTSSKISFRNCESGFIMETKGSICYPINPQMQMYIIAFLNSTVCEKFAEILSPTMDLHEGPVGRLPFLYNSEYADRINKIASKNVELCKLDWDAHEISWNFNKSPLIDVGGIKSAYEIWSRICESRHNELKNNEESINRYFSEIYGLQDETAVGVDDKYVSISISDLKTTICEFLSYAVGCMLGRYSLDVEGLAYAGGQWDPRRFNKFMPDIDNILPITDEQYFQDDILGRFVDFVKAVYGTETLEENLDFISNAIGGKGKNSREIIRNYFIKDFYKDHCQYYQKRPIYWLFDSGKQNGFKALVYMHRYDENTIGNLRIDYLHRMQRIYENEIARMQDTIENSRDAREVTAATKRKEKLIKQLQETKEYDEKIAHLALARTSIDLDDGVKVNYEKVQTDRDGKKLDVLAKI